METFKEMEAAYQANFVTDFSEFDSEEKFDINKEFELVKLAKSRKYDSFDNVKLVSRICQLKLNKIYTYSDLVDYKEDTSTGSFRKVINKNKKYKEYRQEIKDILTNQYPDLLEFLRHKKIKISVAFFINYDQKDLDNLEEALCKVLYANFKKAFIDSLFDATTKRDNCIRKMESEVFKTEEDFEYILIEIETLSEYECFNSSLLDRYKLQQKKKGS